MSKRGTRDHILEKQFHLPVYRRRLVIINIESGNGGHATWNATCACRLQADIIAKAARILRIVYE